MSKNIKNTPTSNNNSQMDMNALMSAAQSIIGDITNNGTANIDNLDTNQFLDKITESVFKNFSANGQVFDEASKKQMKTMSKMMIGSVMENIENVSSTPTESKISLDNPNVEEDKIPVTKTLFQELDSDEEVDIFRPIADDLYYKLPVSLEDLYTGRTKKLMVERERLDKTGRKVEKEKRKFEVNIRPGMEHGQEIRFNKEGSEKYGYRSGDIIITLVENSHPEYERSGKILCHVKNISLYESYAIALGHIRIVVKHLDGSYLILKVDDGIPLHTKDGTRKIRNGGMPTFNKKTQKIEYGDLFIRFNVILPDSFDGDESIKIIEKLFPLLQDNKSLTIFSDSSKHTDFDPGSSKVREVLLEEVTSEDIELLEQLDEEEYSENSDSDSDYDSD